MPGPDREEGNTRRKTVAELWRQVIARLKAQSAVKVTANHRIATFYYRMPDGSVKFSQYHTALTEDGISFHAVGFINPRE